ncbi:MAG: radical SAM protein [Candidatus Shapirobacteria bacterium]|nr:radical SAM protein [Candidatus Shapirobacteria bacterium]MDD4410530.1 radical SAM protein [Candidatus Shapirobacteria bacterium]
MKILLIYPPMTIRSNDTTTPGAAIPLGLANIGAILETNGYNVSAIDALAEGIDIVKKTKNYTRVGLSEKTILERLEYFKPDIVGISTMFTAYSSDSHDVAKIVKQFNPKTLVVFGGAHASILYKNVLHDPNVDIVVIGEGEYTILEIVKKFENKESLQNINGTAIRNDQGEIILNPRRLPIAKLDSLPLPARHLFPMDVYLRVYAESKNTYDMRSPATTVVTSRGCPGNCIYCAVPGIWGRSWRPFSAERIVNEIEFLVKRYGIKEIHFLDDNISVSRDRLEKICDGIIAKKLDIKWTCPNGIAIWTLNRSLLKKMKKSGCYRLTFGIESGHPVTQKFIRKNLNLQKAKKIIKLTNSLGIWTFSTYIIGFPYETKKAIETTFNYAIKSLSDFVVFILLMPFPETDVTKILEDEGLLKKADISNTKIGKTFSGYAGLGNKYLSVNDIRNLRNKAQRKLMLSRFFRPIIKPATIIKKIHNWEDFSYLVKIIRNYLSMVVSTIKFGELKTHRLKAAYKYKILK